MTDKNKTEIVVVLDRSGSMRSIAADMEGGFKTFVEEQKKLPGECVMSLYRFDNQHEIGFENKPIDQVKSLDLVPGSTTALLDGLGIAITRVGTRLAKMPEDRRPGAVVVLVITDGMENASKEYKRDQILSMVKEQTDKYNWQFVYLGSDPSTFAEARSMGMSSAQYAANSVGVRDVYASTSKGVGNFRSAVARGATKAAVDVDAINRDLNNSSTSPK